MRASWLFPFLLLACSASATVDATSRPIPADAEPTEPEADPKAPTTEDAPPAAPDPGAKPDDRPSPTAPTTVRTCGEAKTAPLPLRKSNLSARMLPVALGAAVIDGLPSATERWASGPATFLEYAPGGTGSATNGPDQSEDDLLYLLHHPKAGEPDLFAHHLGGKTPFQTWASALAATARRLTYVEGAWSTSAVYSLSDFTRTPATPAAGEWVRSVEPSRTHVYALAVTFASDCALGAMSDLLGARPRVGQPLGLRDRTLLDPAKRTAIQELLVRDGAEVMIAFASLKRNGKVDELMKSTTCGPTDLAACETMLKELGTAYPSAPPRPTYEALTAGTDDTWTLTDFTTSNVSILR